MLAFKKLFSSVTVILLVLNVIVLIGTVIDLLQQWIGWGAYVAGVVVAPIFSPFLLALPWFEAWVSGEGVNERLLFLWGAWVACVIANIVLGKLGGFQRRRSRPSEELPPEMRGMFDRMLTGKDNPTPEEIQDAIRVHLKVSESKTK